MVQGKRKQKSKRNIFINIVASLLIIVALGLIFNAQIRNMIMVWHTNQYQVSKVSKDSINKNKNAETSFDFNKVESLSTEAVINAQWKASATACYRRHLYSRSIHEFADLQRAG